MVRFNDLDTLSRARRSIGEDGDRVLVEPWSEKGGGQGVALPLELATAARDAFADRFLILAGGLEPGTVREAIDVVGPDAVDVSSGVELAPGIKDPERLVAFLEAVRDARPAA